MEKNFKGLFGIKLGMTQRWDDANRVHPVTVLRVPVHVVTDIIDPQERGYAAVRFAFGEVDPSSVNKPRAGTFASVGVNPRKYLREMRTSRYSAYEKGQEIGVDVFSVGDVVDAIGTSKGKGFAGVMKRHNFKGVGASHGQKRNHRKGGSIGASSTPSRVFRGTRMPGRMGADRVTVKNLRIFALDEERSLLYVRGAVPGANKSIVFLRAEVHGE